MKQNRQMAYPTRKANQVDFQVYASFIDFAPIVVLTFGFIKKVYTFAEYQIKIEFTIKKTIAMSELIFSIFALLYGLFTIYLRTHKNPKAWGKLEKMKNVYGEKAGVIIHIIYYTVVPIVIGIIGIAAYCLEIKIF